MQVNWPINVVLAKICFFLAIVFAVVATFGHAFGDVSPGWLAVTFIAGGLLLA